MSAVAGQTGHSKTAFSMQTSGMNEDHWIWPDRRDLYHSCKVFIDPDASAELVGHAVDALLNDLELYDDPRQGLGSWLLSDELPLAVISHRSLTLS
jgi:hypothetical protein